MITKKNAKSARNSKAKEKTFTVADILMVLGFVALAITTYLGTKLLTGEVMKAILTSAVVVGVSVLFLWIICMAKKAHNNRQGWMIVEVIALVVFIAIFFFLLTRRARHFEYMTGIRDELYTAATHDRDEILGLFAQYEAQETADMATIYNSMKALPSYRPIYMDAETKERVKTWEGKNALRPNLTYTNYQLENAARDYNKILKENVLLGSSYRTLKTEYINKLDSVVKSMEKGTGYGDYHTMAMNMATHYSNLAKKLTALSGRGDLKFEMYSDASGQIHSRLLSRTYESNRENLQLYTYFDGQPRSTAAGWWYTAAVLCLILCAYFATKRSRRVTVMSGGIFKNKRSFTNDGGIDIC